MSSYEEEREELNQTQKDKDYEAIRREMQYQSSHVFELDHLPEQTHRWVDRGEVMSCENGGHESHRVFKRR